MSGIKVRLNNSKMQCECIQMWKIQKCLSLPNLFYFLIKCFVLNVSLCHSWYTCSASDIIVSTASFSVHPLQLSASLVSCNFLPDPTTLSEPIIRQSPNPPFDDSVLSLVLIKPCQLSMCQIKFHFWSKMLKSSNQVIKTVKCR